MKYTDWYPANDPLRKATEDGMDKYFNTLLTDRDMPQENGEPVHGYRFMRIGGDGNLYSPFVHNTQYADQLFADLPDVHVASFVEAVPDQPTEVVNKVNPHEINNDPTDSGFYYWPDKAIAEDYMKVFMHHNHYEQSGCVYMAEIITNKTTGASSTTVDFTHETEPWKRTTVEEDAGWRRETEGRQFPAVYGLFEVEGEAIVKDHSDAGFVMQNMKVIGKPLLTVDANQIHEDINSPRLFKGAVKYR